MADGYLGSPVHCGIGCWTGSRGDVRLQAAVGLEIKDVEWIEGSSWCVTVMLSGWMSSCEDDAKLTVMSDVNV